MLRVLALGIPALVVLTLGFPSPGTAQLQASPLGSVSTVVDGTTIEVEYYRPSVRGRTLFGGIVPWDGVWTPGANWATVLRVDRDVQIEGVEVPAGEYSMWMIPRSDRFTLTLNPDPRIFHAMKPDSTDEQIHVSARPAETAHTEMLTWRVPTQRGNVAVLEFAWGETAVPFEIITRPTEPIELEAWEREIYVGTYDVTFVDGLGFPESGELRIYEEDGRLKGEFPFPIHPDDELAWDLVPAARVPGEGRAFNAGLYRGDELFNVELGVNLEFDISSDDVATAVRISLASGFVWGEGVRAN